ncbi:MAG: peptidoglycan-binding protein [Daejeonella sp.]
MKAKCKDCIPGSAGEPGGSLTRNLIKKVYDSQVGIRETGINRGTRVDDYLNYVNLPKGNPWCAAFVCWVLGKAGVENPRTGWSPGLFPAEKVIWDRGETRLLSGGKLILLPGAGDVFGLYFQEKKRIAHAGFVDQWDGTWLVTVEGNTNDSGSREGDGVYRKRRMIRSIYRVARYMNSQKF